MTDLWPYQGEMEIDVFNSEIARSGSFCNFQLRTEVNEGQ